MTELTGKLFKYIFRNDTNGYSVALFYCYEEKDTIVINGYLPVLDNEHNYQLSGEWTDHPKYGIQFQVISFKQLLMDQDEDLIMFLSSDRFPTIGKLTARRIIDAIGNNVIEEIRNDPSCLDRVEKLSRKQKEILITNITDSLDEKQQDYAYLMARNMSMKTILKIEHEYKEKMMEVLTTDPYHVVARVESIGFETIDKYALNAGFDINSKCRMKGIIENSLTQACFSTGDIYCDQQQFITLVDNQLKGLEYDRDELIDELVDERRIACEQDRFYPYSQYVAENYIAQYLSYFPLEGFIKIDREDINDQIDIIEKDFGIRYQEKQREAIEAFFENDLMILTGGPGTGKTTIVRGMVELCKKLFPYYSITLAAPTGRAAKRLAQLTDCQARTIHSLLGYNMESGKFAKDENDPLLIDLLIIDEFSMVDNLLFFNLLKACGAVRKIIIIGDEDQLPSVNSGALLRDLIACDLFKVVRLEKIYRQKEGSDIISLASDIRNETCEEIYDKNDIRFFETDAINMKRHILGIVEKAIGSFENEYEGFMNVQVLAPKYKGANGIDNLNAELQSRFNPPSKDKRELKVGYRLFREHDKILQLKNQTDDDVYNGDIGIIIEIINARDDYDGQNRIIVDFDGIIVEYTSDTFANITLGYCISVHKAQGSEYPIVIMPVLPEYSFMLQKRLVYTAVTRANRNLIMLGSKNLFFKSIRNHDNYSRKTTLRERLLALSENNVEDILNF